MSFNKCRVCLGQQHLTSIFLKRGSLKISTKIMSLAKVNISPDDGLPSTICSNCIQQLDSCFEFIQLCENSDMKLRTTEVAALDILQMDKNMASGNGDYSLNIEDDCKLSPNSDKQDMLVNENSANHLFLKNKMSGDHNSLIVSDKQTRKQQCFTCGKVMSSRFRLKTHLRTHTGERPFSCPHCSKNFSLSQNLKVHMRVHTGEKPLKCSICGESFAQSAGLATHKRKHTGQTPYQCVLCPRSFRTVGHLQYHVRRHTGEKNFECDTCGKAFITRSDLKQHLLTHSGDRPHVCCICGLGLTRASHLKRHIQHMHNSQNQYSCHMCPLKFTHKVEYENHKKTHVGAKEGIKKVESL